MTKVKGKFVTNYIKALRKERKMTLRYLEEQTGYSNQVLSNLELGKSQLTPDKLEKLARALGVHPLEIIEGPNISMPRDDEECEILRLFRSLPDSEQIDVLGYVAWRAAQAEKPDKSG